MVRAFAFFLLAVVLAPGAAVAGNVDVFDAWARASTGLSRSGAAFVTIFNGSSKPDRLLSVRSDTSDKAEIHTHTMDGSIMKMRRVDSVELSAGATVRFEPGGYHVMLLDLHRPLKEGESIALTLDFEKAGQIEVSVPVVSAGAMAPPSKHAHVQRAPHWPACDCGEAIPGFSPQ
jgi:copper(I)-binding protein